MPLGSIALYIWHMSLASTPYVTHFYGFLSFPEHRAKRKYKVGEEQNVRQMNPCMALYPCIPTCLALDWLACTVLVSLALIAVRFLSTEQCFYESVGYGSYSIYMYTTLMIEYRRFLSSIRIKYAWVV